jgi:hypothetical protein
MGCVGSIAPADLPGEFRRNRGLTVVINLHRWIGRSERVVGDGASGEPRGPQKRRGLAVASSGRRSGATFCAVVAGRD